MADRYFIDVPISPGRAVLAGAEAHHLIHVMRATPGLHVVLFDGSGAEFPAVVLQVGRNEVELTVLSREEVNRELPVEMTLGVALPKGDRQKWLVEKAVELGVTRIVPLRTQRGVAQPVEQAITRLRRSVVEASKQCGRNHLMQIDQPRGWADYVADASEDSCRLLAHPQPDSTDATFSGLVAGHRNIFLAIGPEGGFTDDEVVLATAAGWQMVDLGRRILRVETAALMLAVLAAPRYLAQVSFRYSTLAKPAAPM